MIFHQFHVRQAGWYREIVLHDPRKRSIFAEIAWQKGGSVTWDCLSLRSTLGQQRITLPALVRLLFLASRHFPNYQPRKYIYLPVLFSSRCEHVRQKVQLTYSPMHINPLGRILHHARQTHLAVYYCSLIRATEASVNIGDIMELRRHLIVYNSNN